MGAIVGVNSRKEGVRGYCRGPRFTATGEVGELEVVAMTGDSQCGAGTDKD